MGGTKWGLAAMLACTAIAGAARADPPPPDKSGFTLFNPTPDADLRALCTDRPTKSTGPCTVDAGHFQLESDVFNWTYDTHGGADTTTWLVPNPTLKLGLTNTLDIELNIAPYVSITSKVRATGKTAHASGVGDLCVHANLGLTGDDGGAPATAPDPYGNSPPAARNAGDGGVEEGLIA